jgi:predicted transcriptional regulator
MADLKKMTALIIGSYVEKSAVSAADLPGLIPSDLFRARHRW